MKHILLNIVTRNDKVAPNLVQLGAGWVRQMRSEYIDRNRERSFKVLILVLRIREDILEYLIYMFDIA